MAREQHAWFRQQTGWWMTTIDKKKIKLVKGKDEKAEAQKRLRELLTMRDHNPSPDSGALTVAPVIDLYLTSWLDAHPEWASDWTKNHVVAVIHRPFNWAAKQRLIAANPFRGVSHRAGAPRRPMTDAEFEALLGAADAGSRKAAVQRYPGGRKVCPSDRDRTKGPRAADRFREILHFLRLTGARPGEASKLEWTHIDLAAPVIVLPVHKTSKTQRQKKPRVIPLTQEVVDLLTAIRQRREPESRAFSTHRKTAWNRCNLSLRMRRVRAAAGIPDDAKLYGLRHAFGCRAIIKGVDIKALAELMGHSTVRMTEHYLASLGDHGGHLAAAMRKVSPSAPPASATPPAAGRSRDSETPPNSGPVA